MINLDSYKTIIFDCDGVILNSNDIKTQAFYEVALKYGDGPAKKLKEFHILNGGISRYKKAEYFIREILKQEKNNEIYQNFLDEFKRNIINGLMNCDIADGLQELREKTRNANWMIVSGGDEKEINDIFKCRRIAKYFDSGIYGSPDNKRQILEREIKKNNIKEKALFIGDSKYDYTVSVEYNLDFLFLKDWSEVERCDEWCKKNGINALENLKVLVNEYN